MQLPENDYCRSHPLAQELTNYLATNESTSFLHTHALGYLHQYPASP
ncbi:hypothetical protein CMUST_06780 [Corynebacterium mustelae]|uniref:Uncharacterized protein n=1 Tax=Corynebacterium mustelae TaxID=571915 RepID=A0A0G3GYV3_9CORY|nr:hypothetical protein CMUST_06780 [Corynebacterium mustelae]